MLKYGIAFIVLLCVAASIYYYAQPRIDCDTAPRTSAEWMMEGILEGDVFSRYEASVAESSQNYTSFTEEQKKEWHLAAASQNLIEAQYTMGLAYSSVPLTPVYKKKLKYVDRDDDDSEALVWFKKAAEQGHFESQEMLVKYYAGDFADGRFSNAEEGLFWLTAMKQQPADRMEKLVWFRRQLKEEDVINAEGRAAAWKATVLEPKKTRPYLNTKAIVCKFSGHPEISDSCGNLIGVDGGMAQDGPYLFIDKRDASIKGACSAWRGTCAVPEAWTCGCPKVKGNRLECIKGLEDDAQGNKRSALYITG